MSILIVTECKLIKEDEPMEVDQRLSRPMVGSLIYVTTSRPNVIQAVGHVARFQETLKETHVLAVKRIIIYLKIIIDFGLCYLKERN